MAFNDDYFIEPDGSHNHEKTPAGDWKVGYHPNTKETQFELGNKSGGRPKGSKNKKTLRQELADKGGLSPAELLYSVMNDESANIGQRMKAAEKLMDFTESKLTSIEIHTDEEHTSPFNVFLNLPVEENKGESDGTDGDDECPDGVCPIPEDK